MSGETALWEFTAECKPKHLYQVEVRDLPAEVTGRAVTLRYTVSTDPDEEPDPVLLSSPRFHRWTPAPGYLVKFFRLAQPAHFRFLLTTDAAPPGVGAPLVSLLDLGEVEWRNNPGAAA